jgi:hypothetical protein
MIMIGDISNIVMLFLLCTLNVKSVKLLLKLISSARQMLLRAVDA